MSEIKLGRFLVPIALAGALYSTGCVNARFLGMPLAPDPEQREQLLNREDAELKRNQEYQIRNQSSVRPIDGNTQGVRLFQYKNK